MKKKNIAIACIFISNIWLGKAMAELPSQLEPTSKPSIENEIRLARERVLKGRQYETSAYSEKGKIRVEVKPYQQMMEEAPDWWSEKQSYDLALILAKSLDYYSDLEVLASQTWENQLLKKETESKNDDTIKSIGKSNSPMQTPRTYKDIKNIQKTYEVKPSVTGYSFKYLRPKKQGIGLGFIAITNKSCTAESWLESRYDLVPLTEKEPSNTGISAIDNTNSLASLQISKLLQKTTGGTSLNINFLFGGAGGGEFEPPEKATKELIYDTIVDAAEEIHCSLTQNTKCLEYYSKRENEKPTVEKKERAKRGLFGKKIDDKKRGC